MKIIPSNRVQSIGAYAFAEVDKLVEKLEEQGIKSTDFGVGDPKEPTPELVRNACKKAIDARKSAGYPSYIGSFEFRNAVAIWMKKRFNVDLNPQTEISSTIGSKEAVFNFHEGLIDPGDIVLIPNPGYPPMNRGTLFAEGRPVFLNLLEENNFLPNLQEIPSEIIKKTKILWINYPNNPTASIAPKSFLKEVIDFGHDHKIIIASDEAYSELYYDKKPMSLLELDREGIIVFNSLSKRSKMTCYRIGWVAGDEEIVSIFRKVKTNIDSGTPTFIQDAAIAALNDEQHVKQARDDYRRKKDIILKSFKDIGLETRDPEGTIYIWQKTPGGLSSLAFVKKLLDKRIAIVCTPGAWISIEANGINPGENYVRFALVPTIEEIKHAAERLVENFPSIDA
ncbi:MAG: aminotransferase class I/II-fold pyridoxal phosphate-dependent enzyme [Candidatus Helarchaeota archaeon]|nr:aminotransferase class I/II-fold pyridoxal phosphate-dependent enzyme [Candidatus Helarchaeota archaeon]